LFWFRQQSGGPLARNGRLLKGEHDTMMCRCFSNAWFYHYIGLPGRFYSTV